MMSAGRKITKLLVRLGLMPVVRLFRPRVLSARYALKVERSKILETRQKRLGTCKESITWCGLGLSGGGIRSASLALGVLQAFAEHDLLRRFDYISSVSGGGYLAGSLQWWWSNKLREDSAKGTQTTFGMGRKDFPYGPARIATSDEDETTERARANLDFLRSHSACLTPGNGMTSWSMLAVLIRTAVISLFIWIPLLAGFFAALLIVDYTWLQSWAQAHEFWSPLGNLVPVRWLNACYGIECEFQYRTIFAIGLYIYYGIVAAFVIAAIIFAFMSRPPREPESAGPS
jgi:Patatin-like phospholipase